MKNFMREFFKRGFMAAWGGPAVYAIVLAALQRNGEMTAVPASDAARGIFGTLILAFIAAGITAIYTSEKLPAVTAAIIHAAVLYLDYLLVYLVNGWVPAIGVPLFTGIFFAGFIAVWLTVYALTRAKVKELNEKLGGSR